MIANGCNACVHKYQTQLQFINKVGMNAGVVINGGASCDVDGRIMSTLSTYCDCITLEGGTYGVCGLCVAANGVRAEVIFNNG